MCNPEINYNKIRNPNKKLFLEDNNCLYERNCNKKSETQKYLG